VLLAFLVYEDSSRRGAVAWPGGWVVGEAMSGEGLPRFVAVADAVI